MEHTIHTFMCKNNSTLDWPEGSHPLGRVSLFPTMNPVQTPLAESEYFLLAQDQVGWYVGACIHRAMKV